MQGNSSQHRPCADAGCEGVRPRTRTPWARVVPLVVVLLTSVAFLPSLDNGFVNWDDQLNFIENPNYRGLKWDNLCWMFTTFHAGPYQPLSWLTLGVDYVLWGMDARGYHLTSLLFHVATVLAFYFVALQLMRSAWDKPADNDSMAMRFSAAAAALLFGVHPLRVESVAWATERRDVVSGLFFMLTLLAYVRASRLDRQTSDYRKWLALSVLAYLASLLGKGMAVTMPVLLLVLDWYPLRRFAATPPGRNVEGPESPPGRLNPTPSWFAPPFRSLWLEKVPFLILAVAAGLAGIHGQVHSGAVATLDQYGLNRRIGVSLFATAFYLYKTLTPWNLSPLVPMPRTLDLFSWPYVLSAAVLGALTFFAVAYRRRWPGFLAVWLGYVVMLAPVSGLTQMGPQIAADRYTYLPCLGWALLGGWLIHRLVRTRHRLFPVMALVTASGIAALSVLTWFQTTIWYDSVSLWRHAASIYPDSQLIHQNWGAALAASGNPQEALRRYQEAARLAPQSAEAHNNIGNALLSLGRPAEAEASLRRAIELKPEHGGAHYNLGNVLVQLGRLQEAVRHYLLAIKYRPALVSARVNLANTLDRLGRHEEAEAQWQIATQQDPRNEGAYDNWAIALNRRGHYAKAVDVLRQGTVHCPGDRNLNLRLVWLLATAPDLPIRNVEEAIQIGERLVKATGEKDAQCLDALAAAYAAAGRRHDAVRCATRAVELAEAAGKPHLARQIRERLGEYQAGRSGRPAS